MLTCSPFSSVAAALHLPPRRQQLTVVDGGGPAAISTKMSTSTDGNFNHCTFLLICPPLESTLQLSFDLSPLLNPLCTFLLICPPLLNPLFNLLLP